MFATHQVTFNISINGTNQNETIRIALFGDKVNKTVTNFYELCRMGNYTGTKFFQVRLWSSITESDITNNDCKYI